MQSDNRIVMNCCWILLLCLFSLNSAVRLRCSDGEFFRLVSVFHRSTGYVAGVKVECQPGNVTVQAGGKQGYFSDPYTIGVQWTPENNESFEYKPATCPQTQKMKGFSVWHQGDATVGIRVICYLFGTKDDYVINVYSYQHHDYVQYEEPTVSKLCEDGHTVGEFEVDQHGNLLNLAFTCSEFPMEGFHSVTSDVSNMVLHNKQL
eukprot:TRINITY_DN13882_c0_g2_i2.p2 TRINITY_DN13882_c0_g2~~TRINITY_DN13882_c0_g2_i2.p2  ORF type:complete len:205 (+),score=0.91 TRINITY_DN13882_c0_g2_i2:161-775(+)